MGFRISDLVAWRHPDETHESFGEVVQVGNPLRVFKLEKSFHDRSYHLLAHSTPVRVEWVTRTARTIDKFFATSAWNSLGFHYIDQREIYSLSDAPSSDSGESDAISSASEWD